MDILEVLNNLVCRDHLFSFLETNDLLRLRRVSKTFKDEAQDFIRTKKVTTKRQIEFYFGEDDPYKEFNKFRNSLSGLPIRTRAYFVSYPRKGGKTWTHGNLCQDFLSIYGTSITHLILFPFTLPLFTENKKFQFFHAFPNVTHLLIEAVHAPPENEIQSPASPSSGSTAQTIKIPAAALKKLKCLTVWNVANCGSQDDKERAFAFIAELVETCLPTLEDLYLPYNELVSEVVDMEQVKRLVCSCLFTSPNLKLHVDALCIEHLLNTKDRTPEMDSMDAVIKSINDKIMSIAEPLSGSFRLELPNLERITFTDIDECGIPETDDFVRRDWPKLKEITVRLDDFPEGTLSPKTLVAWNFLFGNGLRRENVVSLDLAYYGVQKENIGATEQTLNRTMDLITSCPSLKILNLNHNIKQIVNLHNLWKGLSVLEELRFWNCKELADSDFIGDDPQNPLFWNLKKLKILKLEMINDIQLTNDLLSKALYQMPIKKLVLSSHRFYPARHSISLKGIRSLLTGQFASTIEHLDIQDLQLSHVSNYEKLNLERRFRSWQMV